jgi:D-arginine dehydrogenase
MDVDNVADVIVIGAGIAGASIAYFLAPHARVLVLEREAHAGVHSTGRSAALFSETYGSAQVRALTRASRRFFDRPPAGFAQHALLTPRGSLIFTGAAQAARLHALHDEFRRHTQVQWLDAAALRECVPVLKPECAGIGLLEPGACDIDVHELHQGFLRGLRAQRGRVLTGVGIRAIEADASGWSIDGGEQRFRAPLLVNAAGAWVDEVARLAGVAPIGIEPRRRSAFLFAPPDDIPIAHWPFVTDIDEQFYFKPDAGLLLGSPANADPVVPHDVQPEEFDIALGIHRIEEASTLTIRRPTRCWAGLRSFVADGDLVGGHAADARGFFWVAAQGGYGIQTSAAMGEACAQLVLGRALPAHLLDAGLSESMLRPRSHARSPALRAAS